MIIQNEPSFIRGSGFGGSYDTTTAALTYPANGGAIIAAAQRNLSGTQRVTMIERTAADGSADAYHFLLIVHPADVISVSALTTAVDMARPAGVQWTLVETDGFTWAEAIHVWSADTFTWNDAANTQP